MAETVKEVAAAPGVPISSWSREQLEGAARVLSAVLVETRGDRSAAYVACARRLLEVTEALERGAAAG